MIQLWNGAAIFVLTIVSCVHINTVIGAPENDCEEVYLTIPEEIKEILNELGPHTEFVHKQEHDGNETTRRCCGKYGCFSSVSTSRNKECLNRTLLPSYHNASKIKFYLWTSNNSSNYEVLHLEACNSSKMVAKSNVVMYINGYLGTGNMPYIQKIKDATLKREPGAMFISVDWTDLSRAAYYRALANGQMVASITAHFIRKLQEKYSITPNNIHIIGINIGAHIAGAVGKRIAGIGRITGLDPVGWNNIVCPPIMRITMSDAKFVHIIHTNAKTHGDVQPFGHLDVFINGAIEQPVCGTCTSCNHLIAALYYLETIRKDDQYQYFAYECDTYDNFLRGKCADGCGKDKSLCAPMGYRAHQWECHATKSPTVMFMSMGTEHHHFHLYHYYIEIGCSKNISHLWKYGRNLDSLKIKLCADNVHTGFQEINTDSLQYTTEPKITSVITSKYQIKNIVKVEIIWTPSEKGEVKMQDCLEGNATTAKDDCFPQLGFNCRCNECIYNPTYLIAKNLETGTAIKFNGMTEKLSPNTETKIMCQVR